MMGVVVRGVTFCAATPLPALIDWEYAGAHRMGVAAFITTDQEARNGWMNSAVIPIDTK
ncbi:MAG TPA: hypothetical protein VJT15_22740 [Pyrinomonadaceae bacterium]|nr:hypothetical protein [Pyrinomonadaceae bacterium]